jgi:aldehyde dehydrogenase (NAD+)
MVVKPSEEAALSAHLFAECVAEAGFPAGVYNMVHGLGPEIGPALTGHPEVDMVSFTGSTAAGITVAQTAAATVKRVAQELGGKSANIVFDDPALAAAVARGVLHCFANTGQSCNAPTRMLVEASAYERAVAIAREVAAGVTRGCYVRPTIFADVTNAMTIAREEVFGPVLVMIPFADEAEAIAIANDSPYGLAAYVQSADLARARRVARALRAGSVYLNGAGQDYASPFGGYKQSGNGRESGEWGLADFLEIKIVNGWDGRLTGAVW